MCTNEQHIKMQNSSWKAEVILAYTAVTREHERGEIRFRVAMLSEAAASSQHTHTHTWIWNIHRINVEILYGGKKENWLRVRWFLRCSMAFIHRCMCVFLKLSLMIPQYIHALFQWCINVVAQLLSVSNDLAVYGTECVLLGSFAHTLSWPQPSGHPPWGYLCGFFCNHSHSFLQNHSVTSALVSVAALLRPFSLYFSLTKPSFQSVTHCYFLFHLLLYYCHCCSFVFATLQTYKCLHTQHSALILQIKT